MFYVNVVSMKRMALRCYLSGYAVCVFLFWTILNKLLGCCVEEFNTVELAIDQRLISLSVKGSGQITPADKSSLLSSEVSHILGWFHNQYISIAVSQSSPWALQYSAQSHGCSRATHTALCWAVFPHKQQSNRI